MPVVTVLMNAYNSAEFLEETLQTVRAQTFEDWEIVFWDNASTDGTPDIAKAFGDKLRYFRAEKHTSLGEARNFALAKVQTELVAFLDCDDLWEPNKLMLQVALFQTNPKLGLASTDTVMFCGKKELNRTFEGQVPPRGMVFEQLVERQWISMSSAMIRMSALRSLDHWFDPELSLCEEADVFYRIALGWELDAANAPLTRWRVHGVNTTFRKFDGFGDETAHILNKLRKACPDFDMMYTDLSRTLSSRAQFQQAIAMWHLGNGKAARTRLRGCLWSHKISLFWLLSFLPGSCFDVAARLYFLLPAFLRKV